MRRDGDFLPDEILTHLFHCLPIKSIIVCTLVSKTWKSLIENPTFISTHLHHSHKNLLLFRLPIQPFEMFGTIPTGDREVYTLNHDDDDDDFTEEQHTRLDFPSTVQTLSLILPSILCGRYLWRSALPFWWFIYIHWHILSVEPFCLKDSPTSLS